MFCICSAEVTLLCAATRSDLAVARLRRIPRWCQISKLDSDQSTTTTTTKGIQSLQTGRLPVCWLFDGHHFITFRERSLSHNNARPERYVRDRTGCVLCLSLSLPSSACLNLEKPIGGVVVSAFASHLQGFRVRSILCVCTEFACFGGFRRVCPDCYSSADTGDSFGTRHTHVHLRTPCHHSNDATFQQAAVQTVASLL